ncbi:MAG: excinuclease ABC subunit UvrA [Gammaproteobacteria bacterium]|nr:excinuclease ABC subunit UvrA [Gammaproteobacteria bacterium]
MSKHILVQNACQNNLKNLDLKLPHGELIVITGVSGSGKSTLAFDTIYAEGQRRYVETFSPYARQFLDRMDKPAVDRIEGIPPAIAIDQTNPVRTSRSTVGTMTELNDHIKLLFARTAKLYCGGCGEPIRRDTAQAISDDFLNVAEFTNQRLMVTFTVDVPENFSKQEIQEWLALQGYTRIHKQQPKHLQVIQDRLKITKANAGRFIEAVETALRYGQGKVTIHTLDDQRESVSQREYSVALQCGKCGTQFTEPTANSFSFNSPIGACESCRGFGRVMGIDYRLVIPDESKTLKEGAIRVFQTKTNLICQRDMDRAAKEQGIPMDVPWNKMKKTDQDWVINGDSAKRRGKGRSRKSWYGVAGFFSWLEGRAYKMHVRVQLAKYRSYEPCSACNGARLKPESLLWRVGAFEDAQAVIDKKQRFIPADSTLSLRKAQSLPGLNLVDFMRLPLSAALVFIERLAAGQNDEATQMVAQEMLSRLRYLNDVGLGYLTLDRQSRTLSGGEVQRINLTTALGTSLVNTLFVLDEPSIGLHPQDMDRVIRVLQRLRDAGNTLIVVEHDPQVMMAADRIIDMGPGPGVTGGNIVFNGQPAKLLTKTNSLTADYLKGKKRLTLANHSKRPKTSERLVIKGATGNNLKNITLNVPLNKLVCITGPSGSGKSTLLQDTLYNALVAMKGKPKELAAPFSTITGDQYIDDIVLVDQSPIGKSARSNPVSYTGAFEAIRKVFEKVPEAKERGYKASAFSFNSGMRCPACSGNGFEHVEMQFLSDVYLRCGECQGRRYRQELLEIKVFSATSDTGLSIADVLELTVDAALEFFSQSDPVIQSLKPLADVGLGYVQLGQPVPTLSGGEAQRLKLAAHLVEAAANQRKRAGPTKTLFLFDEPTTGLHFDDIDKLLSAFDQLLDQGHSLLVIEHNLDVIANADWIVDLGPAGGEQGGHIVCSGILKKIMDTPQSITGQALIDYQAANTDLKKRAHALKRYVKESASASYKVEQKPVISVQQAREHNLKNINVEIPRNKFSVITGMSGSGKSTLAFDIVFNEGQRRYLESLNAYARQFVQPASRPDVDAITGIPPTVAIEQRTSRGGRKSTVATMTEIYHFLRLLFVKLGEQYCPDCGVPISAQSVEAITAQVMKQHKGKRITLYSPLIVDRKGFYTDLAKWALNKGFEHLRVDGELLPCDNWPRLDRFKEHTIDLPVITLDVNVKREAVLETAIQRAVDFGSGLVKIGSTTKNEKLFSTQRACPNCQASFPELDPRFFSYNSKHGWCPDCYGTGESIDGFDEETTGEELGWLEKDGSSDVCGTCDGQRLNPTSLSVYFKDRSIADYAALSIDRAADEFKALKLNKREAAIARDSLTELIARLDFLQEVGLSYLSLDRSAPTLSGGEAQRIRLAAQLGSNLRGVCYILDEPTIGLHPRDNRMLLNTLGQLRKKGNTIIVVEHDEETISSAEHIIDIGPGAGVRGGEVVTTGSVAKIKRDKASITGKMLAKPLQHPLHQARQKSGTEIKVTDARLHNLKKVTVAIPLQQLVCISGVSGSGKSTLIRSVVHDNLKSLNGNKKKVRKLGPIGGCQSIEGWETINRVLEVDQTPIGKTPRSCPATYIGFWDNIRRLFADTTESRIRGYSASRFSFNVSGGRCAECDGQGMKRIEMNFLPDVKVPCEVCRGARFNNETLSIRYKDKSIGDVLSMNVDDAVTFFESHTNIHHTLKLLQDVGLGYLTLGQQSPTLSGGEAQRIKLVAELAKAKPVVEDSSGRSIARVHTLYILDEPTVGLHMADVEKLIHVLHRLVDAGNSVFVIEHNLDLIAEADWIIDMGPEGGRGGGKVVAAGPPKKVMNAKRSRTAPFLQELFNRQKSSV